MSLSRLAFIIITFFAVFTKPSFAYEYKGSLEGGLTIENGNSEVETYFASTNNDLKFKEKWRNLFKGRGENKKENSERLKEEYRIQNQIRYAVSNKNFGFLDLEYIDDRYGGYDYRISETIGFGRNILKNDKINLDLQSSAGLRQTKFSDESKENSWVVRFGSNFDWKITKSISFNEDFDISFDRGSRIIKSDANLKIMMTESLYLKFNLFAENKSDVPQGIKNTDTRTLIIIGYNF